MQRAQLDTRGEAFFFHCWHPPRPKLCHNQRIQEMVERTRDVAVKTKGARLSPTGATSPGTEPQSAGGRRRPKPCAQPTDSVRGAFDENSALPIRRLYHIRDTCEYTVDMRSAANVTATSTEITGDVAAAAAPDPVGSERTLRLFAFQIAGQRTLVRQADVPAARSLPPPLFLLLAARMQASEPGAAPSPMIYARELARKVILQQAPRQKI